MNKRLFHRALWVMSLAAVYCFITIYATGLILKIIPSSVALAVVPSETLGTLIWFGVGTALGALVGAVIPAIILVRQFKEYAWRLGLIVALPLTFCIGWNLPMRLADSDFDVAMLFWILQSMMIFLAVPLIVLLITRLFTSFSNEAKI